MLPLLVSLVPREDSLVLFEVIRQHNSTSAYLEYSPASNTAAPLHS